MPSLQQQELNATMELVLNIELEYQVEELSNEVNELNTRV